MVNSEEEIIISEANRLIDEKYGFTKIEQILNAIADVKNTIRVLTAINSVTNDDLSSSIKTHEIILEILKKEKEDEQSS